MSDTRTDLVAELERLLASAHPSVRRNMQQKVGAIIRRAREGEFHDFKSTRVMPKVDLVTALREVSLWRLAKRVIDGEFDEQADAEDCAEMALSLRDAPELRRMLKLPDPGKT